ARAGGLNFMRVREHPPCRPNCGIISALDAKCLERAHAKVLHQLIATQLVIEFPGVALSYHWAFLTNWSFQDIGKALAARKNYFSRCKSGQRGFQITDPHTGESELSRGKVGGCNSNQIAISVERTQIVVTGPVEQIIRERCAGSDGLHHCALYNAVGKLRIFGLLKDRVPKSMLDQTS